MTNLYVGLLEVLFVSAHIDPSQKPLTYDGLHLHYWGGGGGRDFSPDSQPLLVLVVQTGYTIRD